MKTLLLTSMSIASMVDNCKEFKFIGTDIQTFSDPENQDPPPGPGNGQTDPPNQTDPPGQDDAPGDDDPVDDPPGGNDKTFTQKDVSNIAARESKLAKEKLLKQLGFESFEDAKGAFDAHNKYLDSQKTEQQKKDDEYKKLEKNQKDLLKTNNKLEAQVAAMKLNIKEESLDDAIVLAKQLVSEDVTLSDALKLVAEKYPAFVGVVAPAEGPQQKPKFSSGQHKGSAVLTEAEQFVAAFAGMVPNYGASNSK